MIVCERVIETTPQQRATAHWIAATLTRALAIMRQQFPHEPVWKHVTREWRGHVYVGSSLHLAEYSPQTGCLRVGVDTNGSNDMRALLFTRCFLRLIKETSGYKTCTDTMLTALDTIQQHGIEIDLRCDDIKDNSLINTPYYDATRCGTDAQDHRRWTFPELIGRTIADAVSMLRRGYPELTIHAVEWGMISDSGSYASPNTTVIIIYDPVSQKVVYPEPHLASMPPQESLTPNCFMLSDQGSCLGAPRRVPSSWDALIGTPLDDATNTLRYEYPHAVVETQPHTAPIAPIRRRDRIRVLFDPETGKTTRLLLG